MLAAARKKTRSPAQQGAGSNDINFTPLVDKSEPEGLLRCYRAAYAYIIHSVVWLPLWCLITADKELVNGTLMWR